MPCTVQPLNAHLTSIVGGSVEQTSVSAVDINDVKIVVAGVSVIESDNELGRGLAISPDQIGLDRAARSQIGCLPSDRINPDQHGVLISIAIP